MPARRRTAAASSSGSGGGGGGSTESNPHTEDPAYKLKRKKNNEAVQRTREKTKKTAEDRKRRIEELKEENIRLKERINSEKNHIGMLRALIVQGRNNEQEDRLIEEILNRTENDDKDDDLQND
ncbi:hypothetical protein KR222_000149 [Zaprionus bogoriensis]|nr:hypothetical protein KR222_000149 [Zaprionus bogoriensis]